MSKSLYKGRNLIGLIGDEDTVTGLLLTGIGDIDEKQRPNFMVVDKKTPAQDIMTKFDELTKTRKDIGIVLINQWIANEIRATIDSYDAPFPTILEIPSKDYPYDPSKDSVLKRIQKLTDE
ncbi:H(+)-transporting V1 sector ATPase subunit F [Spiromyces aspiralis]|uniref:H(+)-transporting V1 sector ATPase subunit F n=1 Tax=Spiromyces aspiralis TaxID=68401 RepID=A0ACC1HWZ0_9FUNG|nr:H(+)-transporting V1 sector ATPase subunit F [Spiromyces aspiralis]